LTDLESLASKVIDTALSVHIDVGLGLLESVYEQLLANHLRLQGLIVDRQLPVGAKIDDLDCPETFRIDLFHAKAQRLSRGQFFIQ
jgi:GxxExxY protein